MRRTSSYLKSHIMWSLSWIGINVATSSSRKLKGGRYGSSCAGTWRRAKLKSADDAIRWFSGHPIS